MEHAKSYLKIQNYRYKNQFTYTFDVEENCLSYLCNKITLQPIIENAIYHGMEFMDGEGQIRIKVRLEGRKLLFTVEDNGLGMTPEQVEGLLTGKTHASSRRGSGIGVKNVNERIRMNFGMEYGMTIESEKGVGTKVSIVIPAVKLFENLRGCFLTEKADNDKKGESA